MLSSIKDLFGKNVGSNGDDLIKKLQWGESMEYSEFPEPGDMKKHTLGILIDPEEVDRGEVKEESDNKNSQLAGRDHWMPDRLCKVCYACEEAFGFLRRRHHCRFCGQVFCNTCSSNFVDGSVINLQGLQRTCRSCHDNQMSDRKNKENNKNFRRTAFTQAYNKPNSSNQVQDSLSISVSPSRKHNREDSEIITSISTYHIKSGFEINEDPETKNAFISSLYDRSQIHISSVISNLVRNMLTSCSTSDKDLWLSTILNLVTQVVANVDPNVRQGDTVDIRNYVNIEIIPGGPMTDNQYIDGVAFQKNVAHKKMMVDLAAKSQPKIMLLSCGIDFLRSDNKLATMEILIEQEETFMEILVDKIMSQKPDILLVGKSVARRAQTLLVTRQVVVMQNVKDEILKRVSRMTGAMILSSTEQIMQNQDYHTSIVGTCANFHMKIIKDDAELLDKQKKKRILETRIARGSTYAFFRGCPVDKGCTLMLRGDCRELLQDIKKIINFAIVVAYHLRLEIHFYIDRCTYLPTLRNDDLLESNYDSDDESKEYIEKNNIKSSILINRSERMLLSTSLDVDVGLPYCQEIVGMDIPSVPIDSKLSPLEHQTLLVAHVVLDLSTKGDIIKSKTPPETKGIRFYSEYDVALGQFIVEHCFHMQKPNSLLQDHCLSYIHRSGRIDIKVSTRKEKSEETTLSAESHTHYKNGHLMLPIFMSSFCKECLKIVTPEVVMSDETWKMSFGKFMEILFYNQRARCRTGNCPHHVRNSHILKFACDKYLAEVDFIPVHPFKMTVQKSLQFPDAFHLKSSLENILSFPVVVNSFVDKFKFSMENLKTDAKTALSTHNYEEFTNEIESVYSEISSACEFSVGNIVAVLNSLPEFMKKVGNITPTLTIADLADVNLEELLGTASKLSITEMGSLHIKLKFPLWCKKDFYRLCASWNSKIMMIVKKIESLANGPTEIAEDLNNLNNVNTSNDEDVTAHNLEKGDGATGSNNDYNDFSRHSSKNILVSEVVDVGLLQAENASTISSSPIPVSEFAVPANRKKDKSTAKETSTAAVAKLKSLMLGLEETDEKYTVDLKELGNGHWSLPDGAGGEIIAVDDLEPGSIIAFTLASTEYQKAMENLEDDDEEEEEGEGDQASVLGDSNNSATSAAGGKSEKQKSTGSILKDESITRISSSEKSKSQKDVIRRNKEGKDSDDDDDFNDMDNVAELSFARNKKNTDVRRKTMKETFSRKHIVEDDSLSSTKFGSSDDLTADSSNENKSDSFNNNESKPGEDGSFGDNGTRVEYTLEAAEEPKNTEMSTRINFLENKLLSTIDSTFIHSFENHDANEGTTKYNVNVHFASQFEAMRSIYLNNDSNEEFIRSLSMSQSWLTEGGKSGASFFKTSDNLFIVKAINSWELKSIIAFCPAYFDYMNKVFFESLPSILSKILGVYSISYSNVKKKQSAPLRSYIVMENVFLDKKIDRTFDLKGSSKARYTDIIGPKPETIDAAITRRRHERRNNIPLTDGPVCHQTLLDDNFMETTSGRPVALRFQSMRFFSTAIKNDTDFLAMDQVDVVDYSILVGVDDSSHTIVVGIIDYLRKYDILKRLERTGKLVANIVTQTGESTIIPPKDYQKRFTAAMDRYFTIVPDKWNKNKLDKGL